MKEATLRQGNHVTNMILERGIPRQRLQDLEWSGLLAEILDVPEPMKVSRMRLREALGRPVFIQASTPTQFGIGYEFGANHEGLRKLLDGLGSVDQVVSGITSQLCVHSIPEDAFVNLFLVQFAWAPGAQRTATGMLAGHTHTCFDVVQYLNQNDLVPGNVFELLIYLDRNRGTTLPIFALGTKNGLDFPIVEKRGDKKNILGFGRSTWPLRKEMYFLVRQKCEQPKG